MLIHPPPVYVKHTGSSIGRGVFAARAIADGEVVEVAPVVVFSLIGCKLPGHLKRIMFAWGKLTGGTDVLVQALALGYGSLYNHANPANLSYEPEASGPSLRFTAARDILADEQLFINYNGAFGSVVSVEDDWFDRMDVKPLSTAT